VALRDSAIGGTLPFNMNDMRLNGSALGFALGVLIGGTVLALTIYLLLKGGVVIGPNLALLGQIMWGYEVTWFGSILGLIYGFLYGYLGGYLLALIYNRFAGHQAESSESE